MKSAADVWICGNCRSVNGLGSGRCYKCFTPRELAATKAEDLPTAIGDTVPKAVGTYRNTELRAAFLTVSAIVFILGTFLALVFIYLADVAQADGDLGRADSFRAVIVPVTAAIAGSAVLVTLGAYAFWIHRTVENLPALGLGYARMSPGGAVFEAIVPGVNLVAIASHLASLSKKLEISGRTYPLIGLAGLLIVGPPAITIWIIRFEFFFATGGDFLRTIPIVFLVLFACQAVAWLLLLWVVWQVEAGFRSRASGAVRTAGQPILGR